MIRAPLLAVALSLSACSGSDDSADIAPLPEQTAESANALMVEAEKAAANAAARTETAQPSNRSAGETVNEVTP